MTDVEGVEIHPSVIPGRTDEYRTFLETWGPHCGAPRSVFEGHTNVMLHAELQLAGQDVVAYAQETLTTNTRHWKAIDRLLTDLSDHLAGHDCFENQCLAHMGPGDPICPGRVALINRIAKARQVLGLEPAPVEEGATV